MRALVVKVNIIEHRTFTNMAPLIVNPVDVRHYLIRIPEQGKEKIPVQTDDEAVDNLLKKLKAVKGPKRVKLVDVYFPDDPAYLNSPINP